MVPPSSSLRTAIIAARESVVDPGGSLRTPFACPVCRFSRVAMIYHDGIALL